MDEITHNVRQGKRIVPKAEDRGEEEAKYPVDRYYAQSFLDRYFKKLKIHR